MRLLPEALARAIDACRRALDERPWETPPPALSDAVMRAMGERAPRLVLLSAQSVVPMWIDAHPDDERALSLLDDLAEGTSAHRHLRDALEREVPVRDPAYTALRALLLAHDLGTGREVIAETTSLPDLCAYAWLDARPELVPAARSHEPPARAEAWFRWWLDEAVPSAWHG